MFNKSPILKKYLIGALLGLLVAVLLHYVAPRKFTAEALIQVGVNSENVGIEAPGVIMERLKSSHFVSAVAKRANQVEIIKFLDIKRGADYTVKPIKDSNALIIKIVGDSEEFVRTTMDAVVEEIISVHADILYKSNSLTRSDLLKNEARLTDLNKRIAAIDAADAGKQDELRVMMQLIELQRIRELIHNNSSDRALRQFAERNTSLVYPISVLEKNIFNPLWRASLFGALFGVFVIFLWSGFTRRG